MLYSRIYSYLERFKLLNEHQFGFRKNSSTIHAITSIYDNLLKNIENGMYNCSIFLDLSKAFDTVNHERLIWKLDYYFGIRGIALELLRDYLTNRYLHTKLLNYKSDLHRPLAQLQSARYRCGRSGVRFPGRSNRHSVANDPPPLRHFFGAVLPRRQAAEMGPATRYTLRRNTASIMKI